jgi:8-oxo-dGTP pyrophosphatase MutT (NUDIX family)
MKSEKLYKSTKQELSAGCVVFKREKSESTNAKDAKIKFLLGKHSGYHKWVLPKGLIEQGEKSSQTAARETEEEMGVRVKIIGEPIYKETYFYTANLKQDQHPKNGYNKQPIRRVAQYKEDGGEQTKIFKTVIFYLAEYIAGDPRNHGWEMSEADWFEFNKALELMSFKGEKDALIKAEKLLNPQRDK